MEQAIQFERELADIKAQQAAAKEQHKEIFRRLDKQDELIASVNTLARSVDRLTTQQSELQRKMDSVCDDLDEVKAKPAKRWEAIAMEVIKLLCAAFVGYVLSGLGVG